MEGSPFVEGETPPTGAVTATERHSLGFRPVAVEAEAEAEEEEEEARAALRHSSGFRPIARIHS